MHLHTLGWRGDLPSLPEAEVVEVADVGLVEEPDRGSLDRQTARRRRHRDLDTSRFTCGGNDRVAERGHAVALERRRVEPDDSAVAGPGTERRERALDDVLADRPHLGEPGVDVARDLVVRAPAGGVVRTVPEHQGPRAAKLVLRPAERRD